MIKYILKRIIQVIPVLLGVSIIVFLMLSLSPGDPARLALGMNAKPEQIEAFNHENGLDQPVLVQYVNYMKGLVTGNLGVSYTTKQSVTKMIAVRLPATCILAFGSLVLTYLIAIPLGILLAVKQNTFFDDAFRVVALIVSSIPAFWLGLLLMLLFSVKLGILPSNGFDTPLHWILPLLCSCFGTWAALPGISAPWCLIRSGRIMSALPAQRGRRSGRCCSAMRSRTRCCRLLRPSVFQSVISSAAPSLSSRASASTAWAA